MDYKNTEFNDLALPISIGIDQNRKEKIIAAIRESDLKCIIGTADDRTKVTISVNDLEKLEQLLLSFTPIEDSTINIPRQKNKENLIPILNGLSKMYDRGISRTENKIRKKQLRRHKADTRLNNITFSVIDLKTRNAMLAGISSSFPFISAPVNALIHRNERKIERIQRKVPRVERRLQIYQNTLDKLNKKADHLETRKSVCVDLSSVISSFAVRNKTERSEQYIGSMIKLNNSLQKLNTEKIQTLNTRISDLSSQMLDMDATEKAKTQKQLVKLAGQLDLLTTKNKALNSSNIDLTEMLAKVSTTKVHDKVDKAEAALDKAVESTLSLDSIDTVVADNTEVLRDKDGDHIPDKIDGTYSPEGFRTQTDIPPIEERTNEHRLALITEDEFKELRKQRFIFSKANEKRDDDKIVIRYDRSERERFEKIIAAMAVNKTAAISQKA